MPIPSIEYGDGFQAEEGMNPVTFAGHDDKMRRFRALHPVWSTVRAVRADMMVPYEARQSMAPTGGAVGTLDEHCWRAMVPLQDIEKKRLSCN